MRRPVLWVAAAVALGIAGHSLILVPVWWGMTAIGLVTAWRARALDRQRVSQRRPLAHWRTDALPVIAILIAITGLGALVAAADQQVPSDHYARIAEAAADRVEGLVVSDPIWRAMPGRPASQQAVMAVTAVGQGTTWRRASGRVWLRHHRPAFVLQYGDRVRLHHLIRAPQSPRDYETFDEARWLWLQAVDGVVEASRDEVEWVAPATGWRRPLRALFAVRHRLVGELQQVVNPPTAALLSALLVGDRTALPRPVVASFETTGTVHLLSVSGWHVALLGGVVWLVARLVWPRRLAALATIAGLASYCLLAGAQPPIVRATLMGVLGLAGLCLVRVSDPLNALGAAALAILAVWPRALWDPGCQMSFASVWALATMAPAGMAVGRRWAAERPAWARPVIRGFWEALVISTVAWLGVWPLVAYHLHRVTLVAWVANLVAVPLASLIMAAGLVVALGVGSSPWVIWPWARAAEVMTAWLLEGLARCAALPGAAVAGAVPGWGVLVWYAGLAVAAWRISRIDIAEYFQETP